MAKTKTVLLTADEAESVDAAVFHAEMARSHEADAARQSPVQDAKEAAKYAAKHAREVRELRTKALTHLKGVGHEKAVEWLSQGTHAETRRRHALLAGLAEETTQ